MADVVLPTDRTVRGTLEGPEDAPAGVLACPPHPQHGGNRHDGRLVAIAEAIADRGLCCLRIDYGDWDGGAGEQRDAAAGISWLDRRVDRVGICGYSFGAAVALLAAEDGPAQAVGAVAPPAALVDPGDVPAALAGRSIPVGVWYGDRDRTVDWEPVVDRARSAGATVTGLETDHLLTGVEREVADAVASFLATALGPRDGRRDSDR